MRATATRPTAEALACLKRIESDPNLRHTAARWRAHEAVYPGSGAAEMAERYVESDADKAGRIEELRAHFEARAPQALDDIAYLEWLLVELRAGVAA